MSTLEELKIDDAELQCQRAKLVAEKNALVEQLADINAACTKRLPGAQYHRLQNQRGSLVKMLAEKERELSALRAQRALLTTSMDVRKAQNFGPGHVKALVGIRDHWHDFSMDANNHQKAREAAWKFSQELRVVLQSYFQAP